MGWLDKLYKWLWHDLLCRKEPFTPQFRRIAKAHPVIFWGGIGSVILGVLGGGSWFILHILEVC